MSLAVLGFMAALAMGAILGLLGAGGSILTVPILIYLFGMDPVEATGFSLLVVGTVSAVGMVAHYRQDHVHWAVAAIFCSTSLASVYATRHWLVPYLPDPIWATGAFQLTKGGFILGLFALLMLLSAWRMIGGNRQEQAATTARTTNRFVLPAVGIGLGLVTGLLGAGGGFLIVPALVLLAGIGMKEAVGTSLLIITLNSLTGFFGDRDLHIADQLPILLPFLLLAGVGILVGSRLTGKFSNAGLRRAFGWFVLAMGVYIISHELWTAGIG